MYTYINMYMYILPDTEYDYWRVRSLSPPNDQTSVFGSVDLYLLFFFLTLELRVE